MAQEYDESCNISELIGKTLVSVVKGETRTTSNGRSYYASDLIFFTTDLGVKYKMHHQQNCCESVSLEEIHGDLEDLVGSPITQAEESTSRERPADAPIPEYPSESETWTFYKLATNKGYVTLRWCGSSNGYYSESVDFERLANENPN